MADYQYGGSEEENAELHKLELALVRFARRNFDAVSHSLTKIMSLTAG